VKKLIKKIIKTIKIKKIIKEITTKIESSDIFQFKVSSEMDGLSVNFADTNGELCEDNIWVGKVNDFLVYDDREVFSGVIDGDEMIISVDLWFFQDSGAKIGLNHIKIIEEIINKIAEKYELLKLFSWGADDGGLVLFGENGDSVRSYYYSRGCIDLNPSFAPESEENFWNRQNEKIEVRDE